MLILDGFWGNCRHSTGKEEKGEQGDFQNEKQQRVDLLRGPRVGHAALAEMDGDLRGQEVERHGPQNDVGTENKDQQLSQCDTLDF